jgi:malate dehydrogenase (oxaloacetate-decarboxylating)(NADP+)
VPDSVCRAYGVARLKFGPDYLIPKPFDPRVLVWESSAVAQAAMETGVAQESVDILQYREQLERHLGKAHEISRMMIHKAQAKPKHVVFPEGDNEKILRAAIPSGRKDRHCRFCSATPRPFRRKPLNLDWI